MTSRKKEIRKQSGKKITLYLFYGKRKWVSEPKKRKTVYGVENSQTSHWLSESENVFTLLVDDIMYTVWCGTV